MHIYSIFFVFLFVGVVAHSFQLSNYHNIRSKCDKSRKSFHTLLAAEKPTNFDINSPNVGIAVGLMGILGILVNRFSVSIDYIDDVQSRVDILGIVGCAAVLLNAFSEQEVETKEREAVPLVGFALKEPKVEDSQNDRAKSIVRWAINTLLSTTEATSVHIIDSDKIVGRGGVIGRGDNMSVSQLPLETMPILVDAIVKAEEIYLPDLQILPGKIEFSYLPINAQAVLIIPIKDKAIVTATNKAKSLRIIDILRTRSVAEVIQQVMLNSNLEIKPDLKTN
jgi:hypothetical protein